MHAIRIREEMVELKDLKWKTLQFVSAIHLETASGCRPWRRVFWRWRCSRGEDREGSVCGLLVRRHVSISMVVRVVANKVVKDGGNGNEGASVRAKEVADLMAEIVLSQRATPFSV